MSKRLKKDYLLSWLQVHGSYERAVYRFFKNALDIQSKKVAKEIEDNGITIGISVISQSIARDSEITEAYRKAYEYIGVRHGKWTTDWMTQFEKPVKSRLGIHSMESKLIGFGSEFWRRKITEFLVVFGAEKVSELNMFTVKLIQDLLVKSQAQNLTISQQATFIVETLRNPNYNRMRALRIARTESTIAANFITKEAGKEAPYKTVKEWLSVEDSRTRPDHSEVNGKQVGMDEPFLVGGEEMDRPGDPSASAGNLVNCRCGLLIQPLLDSDGLPIRK